MKAFTPKLLAPGRLLALPLDDETSVLVVGHAVGWFAPEGLRSWNQELSVVRRTDLGSELCARLALTLPEEQIAKARLPLAFEAASGAAWLAVSPALVQLLRAADVRVHTVGADRLTSRFLYDARGGGADQMFECDLVEFASALSGDLARNDVLSGALVTGIDRLVRVVSGGLLGEHDLLLAERLPRLCNDGTGLSGLNVERFEEDAARAQASLAGYGSDVAELALLLGQAGEGSSARAPLFGTAERRTEAARTLTFGGITLELPKTATWLVAGSPARERTVDTRTPSMPSAAAAAVAAEDLEHLRHVVSQAPAQRVNMEVSSALEDAVREASSAASAPAVATSVGTLTAVASAIAPPSVRAPESAGAETVVAASDAVVSQASAPKSATADGPSHDDVAASDEEPGQGLWFVVLLIGVAYFIWHGR